MLPIGTSRTWMERFGASAVPGGSSRTYNTSRVSSPGQSDPKVPFLTEVQFLRLVQPIDESTLPIPRIATKGQKYTFPFTFVVPNRLLPHACEHILPVENDAVTDAHLRLPPSIGDRSIYLDGKDDLAPDMTKITYAVHVRVTRRRESDNKISLICDSMKKVVVSPIYEDAPPLHIEVEDKDYRLTKEKDIRRGFLGKKFGKITASANQPKPLQISPNAIFPPSITIPVSLTFVPNEVTSSPPELGSLTAHLKTSTFYSTTRTSYIPTPSRSAPDFTIGNYTNSILLSSRAIGGVKWEKQIYPENGKPVYRAHLIIPVTAPKCHYLVPSFSSCYMARSYIIDISIAARTSSHSTTALNLKLPLQVSHAEKNMLDQGIDEFFTPRLISPTSGNREENMLVPSGPPPGFDESQYTQLPLDLMARPPNSMPPPGYSVFGSAGSVPQRIPEPIGISPGCG